MLKAKLFPNVGTCADVGGSGNLENDGPIGCWGLDNIADEENGTTEEMLEGTGAEEVENGTKELLDVEEEEEVDNGTKELLDVEEEEKEEEVEKGKKESLDVEEEAVNKDVLEEEEEDKNEFLRFMAALSSGLSSGFLYLL